MRAEVGSLVSETEKLIFPLFLAEQKNSVMRILGQATGSSQFGKRSEKKDY